MCGIHRIHPHDQTVLFSDGAIAILYVDVFDRTGVRLYTVALPPRARLVGAGVRGVYLAIMNDDEEQLVRAQILR